MDQNNTVEERPILPAVVEPLPSLDALIKAGYDFYRHQKTLLLSFMVVTGISFVLSTPWFYSEDTASVTSDTIVLVANLLSLLLTIVVGLMLLVVAVKQPTTPASLSTAWTETRPLIWPFIVLTILTCLLFWGALILFFIQLVIISIYTILAGTVVIAEGKRGAGAFTRSHQLIRGVWWGTFGLVFLSSIVTLLSSFVFSAVPTFLFEISKNNIIIYVALAIGIIGVWITALLSLVFTGALAELYRYRQQLVDSSAKVVSAIWYQGLIAFGAIALVLIFVASAWLNEDSLNQAGTSAEKTLFKSAMMVTKTNMEMHYIETGSYVGGCTDAVTDLKEYSSDVVCNETDSEFAISAKTDRMTWCVDSADGQSESFLKNNETKCRSN